MGAAVYNNAPPSTRRRSGIDSATIAAPAAHSPPIPKLAKTRNAISTARLGAKAHAAVPSAYTNMVTIIVRVRPMRSQITPNNTPPAAQPSSKSELKSPVQYNVAALAASDPMLNPSSVGTQFGAT